MQLCQDPKSFLTTKIDAVAAVANVKFQKKEDCCSTKCAISSVPCLCIPEGCISGSNAICAYIAKSNLGAGLCGKGHAEEAMIAGFLDIFQDRFEVPAAVLVKDSKHKKAKQDCEDYLKALNIHLESSTFTVGQRVSYADVAIVTVLKKLEEMLTVGHHVARLMKTVFGSKPALNKVFPKQKAPATKKEAKKEDAKKEDAPTEAPKAPKAPEFPPTNFNNETWKRVYSNAKDIRAEAMPYFWKEFEPTNWSLWKMSYDKLPEECDKPYVTSNLLGGFLQRVDTNYRKNSFGIFQVLGDGDDFNYHGVWLIRGHELPFELTDHPSFEYHIFTKLDHNKEEDKKIVADYWCSDAPEKIEGKNIHDCKMFK
ncbi:MAG: uncharacterized protein KVP18_003973 [Porospora cf. gigantea A]|uniref:uncharacterized protein n=1 Tax=Porospora cf. gigantea A TaxID=2853593 RepID=UPI003559FD33|nr:MAG: hypothetical protein KVP18_003973 [Porospora cf. gigantea A]